MLNDLKIKNGHMVPSFDSKVFEYNVEVSDVLSLIMDYDTDINNTVTIYGNENIGLGHSKVIIECSDSNTVTTYTLNVNNSSSKSVSNIDNAYELIEVNTIGSKIKDNITPIIGIVTILTLILLFKIIFRKR